MNFIEWNVNFYTGLPDVDQQHAKLIALTNRLGEASEGKPEILDLAFRELNAYVAEHFSLEERVMVEAGIDPQHINYHKNAHALFVAKVDELWDSRDSSAERNLQEMLDFLKAWILQHILHTDREMARAVHAKLGTAAPHNMFTHF
jgi:hemerythrin